MNKYTMYISMCLHLRQSENNKSVGIGFLGCVILLWRESIFKIYGDILGEQYSWPSVINRDLYHFIDILPRKIYACHHLQWLTLISLDCIISLCNAVIPHPTLRSMNPIDYAHFLGSCGTLKLYTGWLQFGVRPCYRSTAHNMLGILFIFGTVRAYPLLIMESLWLFLKFCGNSKLCKYRLAGVLCSGSL